MTRPLAGVLLLAALCWPGETFDVCNSKFFRLEACLKNIVELSGPSLTDPVRYPDRPNSSRIDKYQLSNIRLAGVTNFALLSVSFRYFKLTRIVEKTLGLKVSVEVKAEFQWPSIRLAMNTWLQHTLNGKTRDLTDHMTLSYRNVTFTKIWQMWLMEDKGSGAYYYEVKNIIPGKLGPEIDAERVIRINNTSQYREPANTIMYSMALSHVLDAGYAYLPSIKGNLKTAMNEWLDDNVIPTLEKKMAA